MSSLEVFREPELTGSAICLAGGVNVEENAHIGLVASVLQGLHIRRGAIVGAGAVVTREVPAHTTVVGNPAKPLEKDR